MKDAIHLLTYDIGTTGAKACLFRLGKTLELMDAEVVGYPLITTPDGGSEQRVDDWWKAICQGLQMAGRQGLSGLKMHRQFCHDPGLCPFNLYLQYPAGPGGLVQKSVQKF